MSEKIVIRYAEDTFKKIESKQDDGPAWFRGCDAYGMRKYPTRYLVRFDGEQKWRRVYGICISNAGSVWVTVKGVDYHFRHDEDLRIVGEWPKIIEKCNRCELPAVFSIGPNCCFVHPWNDRQYCERHACGSCVEMPEDKRIHF